MFVESNKDDAFLKVEDQGHQKVNAKTSRKTWGLLACGAVATCAGVLAYSGLDGTTKTEYDANGNELIPLVGEELAGAFGQSDDVTNLAAWNKFDTLPQHYWTGAHERGGAEGVGLSNGDKYFVMKSWRNTYLGMGHWQGSWGDRTNNVATKPNTWEKWRPKFHGGNVVSFQSWDNWWLGCWAPEVYTGAALDADKYWLVFKVASCTGTSMAEGEACLCLKSRSRGTWMSAREWADDVDCNIPSCGPWERWKGWKAPEDWKIASIDWDYNGGESKISPPQAMGSIDIQNGGSVQQSMSSSISTTYSNSESFSNTVGITASMSASVTFAPPNTGASGTVTASTGVSSSSSFGKSSSKSMSKSQNINVIVPAHETMRCTYMARKTTISVPYTAHLKKGVLTKQVHGVYNKVSSSGFQIAYKACKKITVDNKCIEVE